MSDSKQFQCLPVRTRVAKGSGSHSFHIQGMATSLTSPGAEWCRKGKCRQKGL